MGNLISLDMTTVSFRNTLILSGIVTLRQQDEASRIWAGDILVDPALGTNPDVMLMPFEEPTGKAFSRSAALSWQPGEPGRIRVYHTTVDGTPTPCCCQYVIVSERA